ncbi:MAG: hypothetical protein AB8H47_01375 [Bacteroidia bacterium]
MSKHFSQHPVDHPRLFANKYKLSRQLSYDGQGDLWLAEKDGLAYWIYYIPLTTVQAIQLWEKWELKLEDLKAKMITKALILPTESQKEEDLAVVVFPAPNGESIGKEQKTLSELDLALLMLDMSQSLIDAEDGQSQMTISPAYMYRRQEGGFSIFGWGLRALNQTLSGEQSVEAPAYLAPECFDPAQDVGSEASIFSLGVSLFELAAAKLPFGIKGGARLAQVNVPLPELPQYSERFNHILQLMLARKADRRPSADTVFRLASTFIKEQQWKSVGGLSFAPSLSGTPLSTQVDAPKQLPKVEKLVQKEKVKRSPKEETKTEPKSEKPKSEKKNKLWLAFIPVLAGIGLVAWFLMGPDTVETSKGDDTGTLTLQYSDELRHLVKSKSHFAELIEAMERNPNLPPTEKTFLRLAQMQLKNLEMEMQEYLLMRDDSSLAWKEKTAYNWLQSTQSQLNRNIQNLELMR